MRGEQGRRRYCCLQATKKVYTGGILPPDRAKGGRERNAVFHFWCVDRRGSDRGDRVVFGVWVLGGETMAANILLFILGFTSMTTVYEIAKTGKHTKSDKINRAAEPWKKKK